MNGPTGRSDSSALLMALNGIGALALIFLEWFALERFVGPSAWNFLAIGLALLYLLLLHPGIIGKYDAWTVTCGIAVLAAATYVVVAMSVFVAPLRLYGSGALMVSLGMALPILIFSVILAVGSLRGLRGKNVREIRGIWPVAIGCIGLLVWGIYAFGLT